MTHDDLQPATHHFSVFPSLASNNLRLREVLPEDAAAIMDISFYDGKPAETEAEALRMLEVIKQDARKGESVHWGITLRSRDEVVGTCGFYRGYPDNTGELGYVLKEAHRGQGIMTEALRLVIDFGFTSMKLKHIVAYTDSTNHSSIRVLRRLGFEQMPSENDNLKFLL